MYGNITLNLLLNIYLIYEYTYIYTSFLYPQLVHIPFTHYSYICIPYLRDLPLQSGPYAARVAGYQKKELSTVGHGVTMGDKSAIKQCTIGWFIYLCVVLDVVCTSRGCMLLA